MTNAKRCAMPLLLVALATPAAAAGAPEAARNKTIAVSFTVTGNAKGPDGMTQPFSTNVTHTVYVSTEGRLFQRHVAQNAGGTRGRDYTPKDSPPHGGSAQFQGNKLVVQTHYMQGARQMTVTFDPAFTSCSVSVIEGGTAGGVIRRIAPNKQTYEITDSKASSPNCTVQSGNVFAGQ